MEQSTPSNYFLWPGVLHRTRSRLEGVPDLHEIYAKRIARLTHRFFVHRKEQKRKEAERKQSCS